MMNNTIDVNELKNMLYKILPKAIEYIHNKKKIDIIANISSVRLNIEDSILYPHSYLMKIESKYINDKVIGSCFAIRHEYIDEMIETKDTELIECMLVKTLLNGYEEYKKTIN